MRGTACPSRQNFKSLFNISNLFTKKPTQIQFYLQEMSTTLLLSMFVSARASIQPILCIILDQCCPIPLQAFPSEPFSNTLIFKPAFSPKLTTTSLSSSSQDFFAAKSGTFSFNLAILSLTMFDI